MMHYTLDAFQSYRSRLDDLKLVYELMEEIPDKLGISPAMPPFVLPYYNGVEPDDCGISAFVLLPGGHFTLHTFSFHEAYFVDFYSPEGFDTDLLKRHLKYLLPAGIMETNLIRRNSDRRIPTPNVDSDFGPHLFLDLENYQGPTTLDDLFTVFDHLPERINMTPIMRPFCIKNQTADGQVALSALTMIAESHVSIHVYPETKKAFFDIFSCQFFDVNAVLPALSAAFPGDIRRNTYISRGRNYNSLKTDRTNQGEISRCWLEARLPADKA